MKSILDSSFKYTPSAETDLRKTFARLRREQCKPVVKHPRVGKLAKIVDIKQLRS